MANRPIKVLIVEDSPVMRELLLHVLTSDDQIMVTDCVADGVAALEAIAKDKPDVITMDMNMPKMNGFETTRAIMETEPIPVVIVSATWKREEIAMTFRATEAGAVAIIDKPRGIGHPDYMVLRNQLIETVKCMADVKVVRRWARLRKMDPLPAMPPVDAPASKDFRIVAIGASTGGPLVLRTILSKLGPAFPVPVLIVQHIAAGFTQGLLDWIGPATGFPLRLGAHSQVPLPGHAYIAPDGAHMGVDSGGRIILSHDEPENGLRPAISYLFRSVANAFGNHAIGVLLTGMGKDGAEELLQMKNAGALTIVQDKQTCVVPGMSGAAIRLGAASHVLPPDLIGPTLQRLVHAPRPVQQGMY